MQLCLLEGDYAVCRLAADAPAPAWALEDPFSSLTRTRDELSVVTSAANVPLAVSAERGWALLQVAGPLDFALTGVLATLTAPLAEAAIPLFAISTFDTDYLLVKRAQLGAAFDALRAAGHSIDTA